MHAYTACEGDMIIARRWVLPLVGVLVLGLMSTVVLVNIMLTRSVGLNHHAANALCALLMFALVYPLYAARLEARGATPRLRFAKHFALTALAAAVAYGVVALVF